MKIKFLLLVLLTFATLTNSACSKDEAIANSYFDNDSASQTVELLYMGQASLRIVTESGKVIYIDPYAGSDAGYSLPADLILITHEHFDHTAVARIKQRQPGCIVIRSRDALKESVYQTFELEFIKVEAVEAGFNRYHNVDECVGYVLTFNNGKKVYVSGDTSTTNQMREMLRMNIDYAFLCTDGVFNMGNEEAARVAEMINARHTIPYHNSTSNQGDMFDRDAAERFAARNKMILLPGETIKIN